MLRRLIDNRVFRFLVVGGLNSLFGFSVFGLIAYLGGHTWIALLGGNVAGIIFNFFTIGGLVFRNLSIGRFGRFVGAYLALYLINLAAIEVWTRTILIDRIFAQALLTAPLAILSYFVMSRLVFRRPVSSAG